MEALGDLIETLVAEVLRALNRWCVGVDTIMVPKLLFDIGILENMYRQYDMHIPPFWKIKDSRTLFGMHQDPRKEIKFDAHNALEDCKVQHFVYNKLYNNLDWK